MLPAFRPDKAVNIEKPRLQRLHRPSERGLRPLAHRHGRVASLQHCAHVFDFFAAHGCLCADHGLQLLHVRTAGQTDRRAAPSRRRCRASRSPVRRWTPTRRTCTVACAKKYTDLGWVMQLHFGCLRNTNKPQLRRARRGHRLRCHQRPARRGERRAAAERLCREPRPAQDHPLFPDPIDNTALVTIAGCFRAADKSDASSRAAHGGSTTIWTVCVPS